MQNSVLLIMQWKMTLMLGAALKHSLGESSIITQSSQGLKNFQNSAHEIPLLKVFF